MSAFFAIVKKELRAIARERTILIAMGIQLFIASFSSALLIGLLSLYDPDSVGIYGRINLRVGWVGATDSALITRLDERGVNVVPFATAADADAAFRREEVAAILVAPEERGEVVEMKLYLPRLEARASLIQMILQEPLKRYENVLRAPRGVEVRYTDLQGQPPTTFEFIYSALVPILMFFPAFVAGGIVVDSLSEEIENDTLGTLLAAPLSLDIVVGAKIAAAITLAALQCVAWLALLSLNRILVENVALVLLLAIIVAAIIACASALVTVMFEDRERSQFVYALFILVAASVSYLLDVSPIKTIARLASGDYFTGAAEVALFAGVLAGIASVLLFVTRRVGAFR